MTRTWLSWDCLPAVPRQRWHCSGKIQEVRHPETSVHGQLTPQAGREHFFPLISLCIYPHKGSQRASGILTPFSLKHSLLNKPGREGTSIPGGLLSARGFAHCHCWFWSPNLESSIIPFPTLQARKFRHMEVKELGQAPPAIQWQT